MVIDNAIQDHEQGTEPDPHLDLDLRSLTVGTVTTDDGDLILTMAADGVLVQLVPGTGGTPQDARDAIDGARRLAKAAGEWADRQQGQVKLWQHGPLSGPWPNDRS